MKSALHVFLMGLVAVLGFIGCQSSDKLIDKSADSDSTADQSEVHYSAVYIIHGDANYLYHDEDGQARRADEEKVKEAIAVAEQSEKGEYFIFYQRSETKVFGIFPRKDRLLLHYRNGDLLHRERYSPPSSDSSFITERQLFKKHQTVSSPRHFLLYFGHEIPDQTPPSYHRSRPDANFNTELFARGAESFLDADQKFDLVVLSTCNNGTPAMVAEMQPISRYLLASPQNLHLSHIDTQPLLELETNPHKNTLHLAEAIADTTFKRLQNFLETAITLSIYDLEAKDTLDLISQKYDRYRNQQSDISFEQENVDCASLDFWDGSKPSKMFYKPANFGTDRDCEKHSGWGCQK